MEGGSLNERLAEAPTQYSLPATFVPTKSKNVPDTININQFKATLLASVDGTIRYIPRDVWGAKPSQGSMAPLSHPLDYVILSHTAAIGSFSTTLECVQGVREAQELNMSWKWSDIAYNFLIGNDGAIYEGRGWNWEGATAKGWNSVSIGMAFIGKYVDRMPSREALDAAQFFLQYMVDKGIIKSDFTLHCLRQVRDTFKEAPGDELYHKIQTWEGKGKDRWAWRERNDEEAEEIPEEEKISIQHQENITAQLEYIQRTLRTPKDILDILVTKSVLTNRKLKQLMQNCHSDADITKKIIEGILHGRKSHFVLLLEALLETNQRLLAKALHKMIPLEDRKDILKSKAQNSSIPGYKIIPVSQIKFDEKHGDRISKVELGEGSFGAVFLGSYEALGGTKVAIKRVKGSEYGGLSERDKRDFLKEARTMYTLRHPDVVAIYGAVCDSDVHMYCLVMEYMEVGSLDNLLTKIEIPWPVKTRMLLSVARGLTFLNTPQPDRPYIVTHCDIKAKNILINDLFHAKIADFGEAVLQNITSRSTSSKSGDSGHGTVTHMAPEILDPPDDEPHSYDPTEKSDVWSYGITIFESCAENTKGTGERRTPFPKRMRNAQIMRMIGTKMSSPFTDEQMSKTANCGCPQFLLDIMKKCCQIRREDRPIFKEITSELQDSYINEYTQQVVHKAMRQLHLTYERDVLGIDSAYDLDSYSEYDDIDGEMDAAYYSREVSDQISEGSAMDEVDGPSYDEAKRPRYASSELKPELEKLKDMFTSLELRAGSQSRDIGDLKSSVDEVLGVKDDLDAVKRHKFIGTERDLTDLKSLEKKLKSIAGIVHKSISQAKEEILLSNENTVTRDELHQMEERLSRQISHFHAASGSSDEETGSGFNNVCIQDNFKCLVKDIISGNVMDHLLQEHILSEDDYERVEAAVTTRDKNVLLLRMVDRKGQDGLRKLAEALDSDGMEHLSQCLKI